MLEVSQCVFFFFQAEDGIRDIGVTGVQTCALPICVCIGAFGGLLTEAEVFQHQIGGEPWLVVIVRWTDRKSVV